MALPILEALGVSAEWGQRRTGFREVVSVRCSSTCTDCSLPSPHPGAWSWPAARSSTPPPGLGKGCLLFFAPHHGGFVSAVPAPRHCCPYISLATHPPPFMRIPVPPLATWAGAGTSSCLPGIAPLLRPWWWWCWPADETISVGGGGGKSCSKLLKLSPRPSDTGKTHYIIPE